MKIFNFFSKLSTALFFLIVIILGIKSLKEPDTYWMLLTGEWISQHGEVVSSDPFSFTRFSTAWINVKWLFELLIYYWQELLSIESIPFIQSIVYFVLFWFLLKRFKGFQNKVSQNNLAFILIGLFVILGIEFRMLGRPEMISHLFLVIQLFLLERYHRIKGNLIFLLMPLQIIWSNAHEAFGIGMVVLICYLFSAFAEKVLFNKSIDKKLILALVGALLSVAINPIGFRLFLHPLNIFSQVDLNKYTYELLGFRDPLFWKMEAFIFLSFFILVVISWVFPLQKQKKFIATIISKYGLAWILLFFAFFYLGFSAYRNLPFFILFAAPVLMASLQDQWINKIRETRIIQWLTILLPFFLIAFYVSIVSNYYYRIADRSERYGLELDVLKNPVGVSQFMKKVGVKGQGFVDYLSSSYLLWDQRPHFKSFIDLRDLDVFEPAFFDDFFRLNNEPQLFFEFDKAYDFQYAVIYRPELKSLQKVLDQHPKWELVYADPVATFYFKVNEKNQAKIDSLNANLEGSIFKRVETISSGKFSSFINHLFNPFYQPNKRPQDFNHHETAARYYMNLGDYNAAYYHAKLDEDENGSSLDNLNLKARIYLELYLLGSKQQQSYFKQANQFYQQALVMNSQSIEAFKGLGILAYSQGQLAQAEKLLIKAIAKEKDFESLSYLSEILAQSLSNNPNKSEAFYKVTKEAYDINPGDFIINYKLLVWNLERNRCDELQAYLELVKLDARAQQSPYKEAIQRASLRCK